MELKKIKLPFRIKRAVLALGSQTKNTICFAKDNLAYLSQTHSDLIRPTDFLNFEKTVKYFLKKHPKIIAYDLHPEYESTKYALSLPTTYYLLPTQHHHAHIASCMAENNLKNQKVIGVAFDGTGLGDDNTLWGAEFLICDYSRYERKAHLRCVPLIAGEIAIRQPWRVAIIWLYLIYKDRMFNLGIDFVKKIDKKKWLILKSMYDSEFNCPLASSMGRFFDATASLVLNKFNVKFEAEAAIELEKKAIEFIHTTVEDKRQTEIYHFKIKLEEKKYIIDPVSVITEIISDLKNEQPKEIIAYKFHYAIAEMIRKICSLLRKETEINEVVLSGGVFQNKVLLKLSLGLLYKDKFRVLVHKQLNCNDSVISLGQAAIANFSRPAIKLMAGSRLL